MVDLLIRHVKTIHAQLEALSTQPDFPVDDEVVAKLEELRNLLRASLISAELILKELVVGTST